MEAPPKDTVLFTCLSCSIAFLSAEEQRLHYRSDFHRYNMKRRVASLPPVGAAVFDQKVLERKAENAVMASPKNFSCQTCNKVYTSEGAYRSHMNSKKHKENESKAPLLSTKAPQPPDYAPEAQPSQQVKLEPSQSHDGPVPLECKTPPPVEDASIGDEVTQSIDEKIAAARARLSTSHCLFCTHESSSLEANLTHLSSAHSFFIPDADYLVNLSGLITYLGEKIAVGNVCIFCNEKSREFRSLEAVRKHMVDKGHCKLAYDSPDDRMEVSDFYDFTSSYPDTKLRRRLKAKASDEEWEDVEGDSDAEDADEIVDQDSSETESEDIPDTQLTYGDSPFELVLPSGARIGHRSLRRYYAQSFRGSLHGPKEDPNSGAALVRRLLDDKHSALVPRKGGFGAFGQGTEVVKARNRGEAREAGKHIRQFRDQRRREDFKTKVGFIANAQKHYRDPLLQ